MEKIKKRIMNDNGGFYIYFALYAPQLLLLFSALCSNWYLLLIGLVVDFAICFAWFKLTDDYGIVAFCQNLVVIGLFSLGFFWIGIMLLGWN